MVMFELVILAKPLPLLKLNSSILSLFSSKSYGSNCAPKFIPSLLSNNVVPPIKLIGDNLNSSAAKL